MAENKHRNDVPYDADRNTEPGKDTGNINDRNNNVAVSTPGPDQANVETASREGIGDAAENDQKLTRYTSNHSADA